MFCLAHDQSFVTGSSCSTLKNEIGRGHGKGIINDDIPENENV